MNRKTFIVLLAAASAASALYLNKKHEVVDSTTSLTIALEGAPMIVDPVAVTEIHSSQVATAIHSPLAWIGQDGKVIPMVANRLDLDADAKKLTISLNPKATFWNGSSVTSQDVIYSLERYRRSQNLHRWILDRVEGIKAFDDKIDNHVKGIRALNETSIEIKYTEPEPDAAMVLCNLSVAIVQKGSGELEPKPFGLQVMGCGPYAPADFDPTTLRCRLRTPYVDRPSEIVFRVISDDTARLNALATGQTGLVRLRGPMIREACDIGNNELTPKTRFAQTKVSTFRVEDLSYLIINWQCPTLAAISEVNRRPHVLALSGSIDRQSLVSELFPAGSAMPTSSIATPSDVVSPVSSMPTAPTGTIFPAKLTLVSANDAASRQLAIATQLQLRSRGIEIGTEFVDLGRLIEKLVKKDFDLLNCWMELQVPSSGPYAWCSFFDNSAAISAFGEAREDVGPLLSQARSNTDSTARAKTYANIVKMIDEKQVSWVPLMARKAVVIHSSLIVPAFDINGTPINGLIRCQ